MIQQSSLSGRIIDFIEAFLDAGDAVRRRKQADRIYRDLTAERISQDRAALELHALTQRQKGGWLSKGIQRLARRMFGWSGSDSREAVEQEADVLADGALAAS
ncbi:MAG: hypothetical protein QF473_22315 [Planctomycetota bacterium]|jgi:hypothetical protein|nr:hypothetical protein [Planctomycetota bacterium]MDP6503402.1 hypothetical protein [Planctomycetota bacterium]